MATDQPTQLADAKSRIGELEERDLAQRNRIAWLENRIRSQDRHLEEGLQSQERQIESLKEAISGLKEAHNQFCRDQADVCSRVSFLEGRIGGIGPPGDAGSGAGQGLGGVTDEVSKMKEALTCGGFLAERLFDSRSNAFQGIISHLTEECGGNVADRGTVAITASTVYGDRVPRNVADLRDDHFFNSLNWSPQWIEWDFKTAQIEPTHYSIRTHGSEAGGLHLRHWVLEGRNFSESWQVLDCCSDDFELNGRYRTATFEIRTRLRVGKVRLRQTGLNHRGNDELAFCGFEFFGGLFRNTITDFRFARLGWLECEVSEMKTALIESGVLAERFMIREYESFDGSSVISRDRVAGMSSIAGLLRSRRAVLPRATSLHGMLRISGMSTFSIRRTKQNNGLNGISRQRRLNRRIIPSARTGMGRAVLICGTGFWRVGMEVNRGKFLILVRMILN
jgi:hypothetical protein